MIFPDLPGISATDREIARKLFAKINKQKAILCERERKEDVRSKALASLPFAQYKFQISKFAPPECRINFEPNKLFGKTFKIKPTEERRECEDRMFCTRESL